MIFYIIIWSIVLLAALTFYIRQTYSRFSVYGVKHMKFIPFLGHMMRLIFRLEHFTTHYEKTYKAFPDERFVGRFEFTKPTLFIRDLELIKKITIKDFEYFLDHRGFTDEAVEPLFGRNLFSLKGEEWKDMRSTLSPAFTSSKIKLMVPFMEEVGEQMIKTIKQKINESNGYIEIDCKDLTTRFATDVIGSCAFGLKVDSQTDKNNKFYLMGRAASTFKFRQMLVFFAMSACPALIKIFKLTLFSNQTKDFFINLVLHTMKDRESRKSIRPDMIHLLMEAKKGQLSHDAKIDDNYQDTGFATVEESSIGKKTIDRAWSDIDLVAQAVLFFIAGFETASSSMSFALHELALHPEIQERLAKEIKEHHAKNDGKLNFNSIQTLTYMDMVTSEVLRLWPPGIALERLCGKDYNLGKPNEKAEKDFIMRKGELLWIPVWCIHRDPKYFPNPTKFDPERFSNENKHKINPMAYMPFGVGPRNCIGSRFALCELKAMLYRILLNFELTPSEKTVTSGKLSNDSFNIRLAGGFWLGFQIRD